MTPVDFKIKRIGSDNEMNSKAGYVIEMDSSTNNEVPHFTDNLAELYTQTIAVMATINKGQLLENEEFGITSNYKILMQGGTPLADVYKTKMLTELTEMCSLFLMNNPEILDFASSELNILEIGGYNE